MSGSAHPTTSAGGPSAEQLIYEMRRACGAAPPVECLSMTLGDGRTILDEIDALTARLAVWEQLRPDIAARDEAAQQLAAAVTNMRDLELRFAAHCGECELDPCSECEFTGEAIEDAAFKAFDLADVVAAADRVTRTLKEQQP